MRATVFVLLSALLHAQVSALCTQFCLSGDVLYSATECYHDVAATYGFNCPSGYTVSGTTCSKDMCNSGSNAFIGSQYIPSCPGGNTDCTLSDTCSCQSGGYCCFCYSGSRAAPAWTGSYYSCGVADGGPGGSYMTTATGQRWCYLSGPGNGVNCPGSFTGDGGTCQVPATSSYTCPSGFTMLSDGITCRQIYAPSPITTSAQCAISPSATGCDWCSGINVCMPTGTCYGSCLQATASQATCTRTGSLCQLCSTLSVCQLKTEGCYGSCLSATANSAVCSYSGACQWCSFASGSIDVCQPNAGVCYSSCLLAYPEPAVCSTSGQCQWCATTAGSIGICQPNGGTCYATCLAATVDSSQCSASQSCMWCTTIGGCQPKSGVCYADCLEASAELPVCSGSLTCQWCSALGYCTLNTRTCHTVCTTIAPDDPAICQVASIQAACEWCGALQYCVGRGDGSAYRCASRCETMIWRQDICSGALDCHWCAQHGGRCKPIAGQSQGFLSWRREVECETGSESSTSSAAVSATASHRVSESTSHALTETTSESAEASPSESLGASLSLTRRLSLSKTKTKVPTDTASNGFSASSTKSILSSFTLELVYSASITVNVSHSGRSPSPTRAVTKSGYSFSLTTRSVTLVPTRTRTQTITVIPNEARPQVLRTAARVMGITAATIGLIGVLSLSAGGPMLNNARLTSQLSIMDCGAEGVSLSLLTNPIQLCLGADTTQCYRGSVVGNTGLLLGVCIAGFVADWLRRSVSTSRRVPPVVISAFALLLGGWASCSVSLVVVFVTPAVDVALGLLGGALSVVGLCWSWWCATHLGDCKLVWRVEDGDDRAVKTLRDSLIGVLRGNCKWCSCSDKFRRGQLYKDAIVAWYGAADCSFTVCCAVLEGLSNAAVWGDTYCSAASWLFLVLTVCLFAIAVYFRPMLSHADNVFLWSTCGIAVLASALQLVGLLTQNVTVQVAGAVVALLGMLMGCAKLLLFILFAVFLMSSRRDASRGSEEVSQRPIGNVSELGYDCTHREERSQKNKFDAFGKQVDGDVTRPRFDDVDGECVFPNCDGTPMVILNAAGSDIMVFDSASRDLGDSDLTQTIFMFDGMLDDHHEDATLLQSFPCSPRQQSRSEPQRPGKIVVDDRESSLAFMRKR